MKSGLVSVADLLRVKGPTIRTIQPTATISALARQLREERIGAMIVSHDGTSLDGIISERDVAYGMATHPEDLHAMPVSALMTSNVITCSPEDTLVEVASVMTKRHFRHLPVAKGKQIAGIISMRDVFMHRVEEVNRLAELVSGY